jgi:hypothetical protein
MGRELVNVGWPKTEVMLICAKKVIMFLPLKISPHIFCPLKVYLGMTHKLHHSHSTL